MQHSSAMLICCCAFLGGIACLTRFVILVRRSHVLKITMSPVQHILLTGGVLCALGSFLFLPAGSFPAWIACSAPALWWLAAFGLACTALALLLRPRSQAARALIAPAVLSLTCVLCAWFATRHGLPGAFWNTERFAAVPLLTHASPAACASLLLLACSAILACATAFGAQNAFPFLATSLQLAAAQFIVCLFVPPLSSCLTGLPTAASLLADVFACWACTLLLLPLFHAAGRIPVWLPWVLAAGSAAGLLAAS